MNFLGFRKLIKLVTPEFPRSLGLSIVGWVQAKSFEMRIAQQTFELSAEVERLRLLARDKHQDPRDVIKKGFSVFSQYDEDGIISSICSRLPSIPKKFVEIGTGGSARIENNTFYLLLKNWKGLWVEGDEADFRSLEAIKLSNGSEFDGLDLRNEFVTVENVNSVLSSAGYSISDEIGVLSIDIDSIDLNIIEALNPLSAAIIVVEYNAIYPPEVKFRVRLADPRIDGKTSYFGASLSAFREVLERRGYKLIGCTLTGANAFFIRSDLASPELFMIDQPTEWYYEPPRYYLAWGRRNGMIRKMAIGKVDEASL